MFFCHPTPEAQFLNFEPLTPQQTKKQTRKTEKKVSEKNNAQKVGAKHNLQKYTDILRSKVQARVPNERILLQTTIEINLKSNSWKFIKLY